MITSKDFILRLLRYKDVLNKLKSLGFVKVFSDNLVDSAGVSSSQVRKDFALLSISGNKRGGYRIDDLITQLNIVLGKDKLQEVIIVGCGKIGQALMNYTGFQKEGIKIIAGFDLAPEKIDQTTGVPIYGMDSLPAFVKEQHVKVGIIAVPLNAAKETADALIDAGVLGILNFAPVRLKAPDETNAIINNMNIEHEIENLFYFVNTAQKARTKKNTGN